MIDKELSLHYLIDFHNSLVNYTHTHFYSHFLDENIESRGLSDFSIVSWIIKG